MAHLQINHIETSCRSRRHVLNPKLAILGPLPGSGVLISCDSRVAKGRKQKHTLAAEWSSGCPQSGWEPLSHSQVGATPCPFAATTELESAARLFEQRPKLKRCEFGVTLLFLSRPEGTQSMCVSMCEQDIGSSTLKWIEPAVIK